LTRQGSLTRRKRELPFTLRRLLHSRSRRVGYPPKEGDCSAMKSNVIGSALRKILAFSVCSICFVTAPIAAETPMQVIRAGTQRALEIIGPCTAGQTFSVRRNRDKILEIVYDYVDFREMGMRCLGLHWKRQPPAKREEFLNLFEDLLFNTYIDRVDTYTCGNEKIAYDEEEVRARKYALVKTRVVGYQNTDIPVNYRMKLKNGEWKVYDVVVEGVSLVENYRGQFNSILSRNSFDELLERMRGKALSPSALR